MKKTNFHVLIDTVLACYRSNASHVQKLQNIVSVFLKEEKICYRMVNYNSIIRNRVGKFEFIRM